MTSTQASIARLILIEDVNFEMLVYGQHSAAV